MVIVSEQILMRTSDYITISSKLSQQILHLREEYKWIKKFAEMVDSEYLMPALAAAEIKAGWKSDDADIPEVFIRAVRALPSSFL